MTFGVVLSDPPLVVEQITHDILDVRADFS
jgi:hypothetical protein